MDNDSEPNESFPNDNHSQVRNEIANIDINSINSYGRAASCEDINNNIFDEIEWEVKLFLDRITEHYKKYDIMYSVTEYKQTLLRLLAPIELKGITQQSVARKILKNKNTLSRVQAESSQRMKFPLKPIDAPPKNFQQRQEEISREPPKNQRNTRQRVRGQRQVTHILSKFRSQNQQHRERESPKRPKEQVENQRDYSQEQQSNSEESNQIEENHNIIKSHLIKRVGSSGIGRGRGKSRGGRRGPGFHTAKRRRRSAIAGVGRGGQLRSGGYQNEIRSWILKNHRKGKLLTSQKICRRARKFDKTGKFVATFMWYRTFLDRNPDIKSIMTGRYEYHNPPQPQIKIKSQPSSPRQEHQDSSGSSSSLSQQ